ncbi:MAG TPA: S1/P1 nuclease [Blastocatellia bacterium]|nr:S1/P1 nuclease [Blastocatellia bacterium]
MNRLSRLTASTLLLILALSVSSYGWSDTGHMAAAFVAYQKLTPQVRARVDALVRLNPRFSIWSVTIPHGTSAAKKRMMLFMIAATWPDQIKHDGVHQADGPENGDRPPTDGTAAQNIGYSDTAMHKYWHFIDQPFSPDSTPLQNPPVPNAATQIAAFRAVLASNSPDPLKSYDLVWLLHLVGDVHQPLHCTSRFTQGQPNGDAGGNNVNVRDGSTTKRLHAFWDGLLGTSRDPAGALTVGQSLPAAPASLANNLDAAVWIDESFAAAKSTAYKQPPIGVGAGPFTITSTYRNAARALAKKRVALAGARLANILNAELR